MKLRVQMVLAGIMTLAVPLVGWHSVRQLNDALVQSRINAQQLSVANLQLRVAKAGSAAELQAVLRRGTTPRDSRELYLETATTPLTVDGYADDWRLLKGRATQYRDASGALLSVRSAEYGARMYLLIHVDDDDVVWHRPPRVSADVGEGEWPDADQWLSNGDSVDLLWVSDATTFKHMVLRAIAPGTVPALTAGASRDGNRPMDPSRVSDVLAAWQLTSSGYVVEVSMPLQDPVSTLQLGIASTDVDDVERRLRRDGPGSFPVAELRRQATQKEATVARDLPRIYTRSRVASELLAAEVAPGRRARLFDQSGRLIADVDRLNERREDAVGGALFDNLWDAILFRTFSWLVAGDLPLPSVIESPTEPLHLDTMTPITDGETRRYVSPSQDRVLGTAVKASLPVAEQNDAEIWLWYESNEEHSSAYTGSRLARLFSLLILASLVASSLLFAWGAWLSLRIRRLSRAAAMAVSDDGRPRNGAMRASKAPDELGVLSRDLASLLERSADYNRYLEALSKYLSHELRTPLSVVRTSLENLQHDDLGDDSRALLMRAAGGAEELARIISSILASTRLEQTIEHADRQRIDLDRFLDDCLERYRSLYPNVVIDRGDRVPDAWAMASPELLLQALDKLLDNAVEYTSEPRIWLSLDRRCTDKAARYVLTVLNPVDSVPSGAGSAQPHSRHLGLGLHMVRIIAEGHGGRLYQRDHGNIRVTGMTLSGL